jgi:hypothetical protein
VDGFPIPNPDGTLGFGLSRSESTEGLAHIDENDCLDVPRLSSQSWSQNINETRLTFTNREIGWKEDLITAFNLASCVMSICWVSPQKTKFQRGLLGETIWVGMTILKAELI